MKTELKELRQKIQEAYTAYELCCENWKQEAFKLLNSLRDEEIALIEELNIDED
jgi:hypothetical protein